VTDFLSSKRDEIAARLRELEPVVEEYRALEAAAKALASVTGPTTIRRTRRTTAARAAKPAVTPSRRRRPATTTAVRRGRPRGTGARAAQALQLVGSEPGITIGEIAAKMGIKQNYLYRVLPALEKDGRLVKRDRGWHPAPDGQPDSGTGGRARNATAARAG
jgi:sugar-specific transcriptional regulator TrmB